MLTKVRASSEFTALWIELFGLQKLFGRVTGASIREAFLGTSFDAGWERMNRPYLN
jgi:hypothetical protein